MGKSIYKFSYAENEESVAKLESKYLFSEELTNKVVESFIRIDPCHSAFVKSRLDVLFSSTDFKFLVHEVENAKIFSEDFKVEYLRLSEESISSKDRLQKVRSIGLVISGEPDYYDPKIVYGLCYHRDRWSFGLLKKNSFEWKKHKEKPQSFSNSMNQTIAKALVNIGSGGMNNVKLVDVCCGAGTIMLEANYAGLEIEGCDINEKMCQHTLENLSFFNYSSKVYHSDIKNIDGIYDAAIVDLPYNLRSKVSDEELISIIKASGRISSRQVIVSTKDITSFLEATKLKLLDHCVVKKRGKVTFSRQLWVCSSKV